MARPSQLAFLLLAAAGILMVGGPSMGALQRSRSPASRPAVNVVREERTVLVDGRTEVWRLVWRKAPQSFCGPEHDTWATCPCSGFEFGEWGTLDLVRLREGIDVERLGLNALFQGEGTPGGNGIAALPRWTVRNHDIDQEDSPGFAARVRSRPVVEIMHIADFDHDGSATEFFLHTGNQPCGKATGIMVGLSASNRHLHAFGSTNHPKKPLVLQWTEWKALRDSTNGKVEMVDWHCADHGSDGETRIRLQITPQGIQGDYRDFACRDDGKRGRLLETRPLESQP